MYREILVIELALNELIIMVMFHLQFDRSPFKSPSSFLISFSITLLRYCLVLRFIMGYSKGTVLSFKKSLLIPILLKRRNNIDLV